MGPLIMSGPGAAASLIYGSDGTYKICTLIVISSVANRVGDHGGH